MHGALATCVSETVFPVRPSLFVDANDDSSGLDEWECQ